MIPPTTNTTNTTNMVPGWPDYQKSTKTNTGNCVAVDRTRTSVRDTKDMAGGELRFADLGQALSAVKSGRFDLNA